MSPGQQPSIRGCLQIILGFDVPSKEANEIFINCDGDLEREFTSLKKVYFRKILQQHPDKGGDPAVFRKTQTAFDLIRERAINNDLLFSFLNNEELMKDDNGGKSKGSKGIPFDEEDFFEREGKREGNSDVPSYEYYYEAAQEVVPGYKVELAKSGRSRCSKCKSTAARNKKKAAKAAAKNPPVATVEPSPPPPPTPKLNPTPAVVTTTALAIVPPTYVGKSWTVKKIKEELAARSLVVPKKGKKAVLVAALEAHDAEMAGTSNEASVSDEEPLKQMTDIVESLLLDPACEPFYEPVDWKRFELFDYPQIITRMSDLGTIKKRLMRGDHYYSSALQVAEDIRLIWKNCMTYNEEGSEYWLLAKMFAKQFEDRYRMILKNEIDRMSQSKTTKVTPPPSTLAEAVSVTAKATATIHPTTTTIASPTAVVTEYSDPTLIAKNSIRVGSLIEEVGSYGRWNHLPCWRVPYRVWAGLTDPSNAEQVWSDLLAMDKILLTNVSSLLKEEDTNNIMDIDQPEVNSNKELFIAHVMDRGNWARKTSASKPPPDLNQIRKDQEAMKNLSIVMVNKKRSAPDVDDNDRKPAASSSSSNKKAKMSVDEDEDTTMVPFSDVSAKMAFKIPTPEVDGAQGADLYKGKRFVLTGTFPEVGGGMGLGLGKDRTKQIVESFGGRVTSAVSGVTDFLVVGKQPGASKVAQATAHGVQRIDLKSIGEHIYNKIPALEQASTPKITSFSDGPQWGCGRIQN